MAPFTIDDEEAEAVAIAHPPHSHSAGQLPFLPLRASACLPKTPYSSIPSIAMAIIILSSPSLLLFHPGGYCFSSSLP